MTDALPIDDVLKPLVVALTARRRAVLQALPGAGKTTRVPLKLLESGIVPGRIVMLEPRRLAARAAAERMAETLGERAGQTVGYRVRGESKVSKATRIEVVTEGILTRMLQSDPDLPGIGAVIFDEFHERSLNADLGLALTLETVEALRENLMVLVMSATLDAAPVAALLGDAPVITSEGRSFPVEARWLDRPMRAGARLESETAALVAQAAAETKGGILVFLPGEGEIRRTASALSGQLTPECVVMPLCGGLPFAEQRRAIRPLREVGKRKVVLATAIAETSLTIEDVRVVVDAGRARRARFDPGSGMSRLVTERVTRAEAAQRAGRAGRVAPGVAYKLWSKGEEGGLAPYPPAEIEAADLAGLALELAAWGAAPEDLALLTQPNAGVYAEARKLLGWLGALDDAGRITDHGRRMARLPLHPRLAHMLLTAGAEAAPLAALLSDRDPLRGASVDLTLRLRALKEGRSDAHRATLERIRAETKRLARAVPGESARMDAADWAALAYPDRIGLRRKGDAPRYVLSGGKGAVMPEGDPLAGTRLIVATDLDGDPREACIRQAIAISESAVRALFADDIIWHEEAHWSRRDRRVQARRQERLGALVLKDEVWKNAPPEALAGAMLEGVRELGLTLSDKAARYVARVERFRAAARDAPDMTTDGLLADAEAWLLPHLTGLRSAEEWKGFDLLPALRGRLDWPTQQAVDAQVPEHFTTPLGRNVPIDYGGEHPSIALRLQELFGVTRHPTSAGQPLRITLLSPAGRPVQTTMDLPGFWATSYADVRKDMRGRYPKHPWPEDPTAADPTLRAKRKR